MSKVKELFKSEGLEIRNKMDVAEIIYNRAEEYLKNDEPNLLIDFFFDIQELSLTKLGDYGINLNSKERTELISHLSRFSIETDGDILDSYLTVPDLHFYQEKRKGYIISDELISSIEEEWEVTSLFMDDTNKLWKKIKILKGVIQNILVQKEILEKIKIYLKEDIEVSNAVKTKLKNKAIKTRIEQLKNLMIR